MASEIAPLVPQLIGGSTSLTAPSAFPDSGRDINNEPFGSSDGHQMVTEMIHRNYDEKFALPQAVELDSRHSAENMEEDEVQIVFEGVMRPCVIQNTLAVSYAKEFKKLAIENRRLTKEIESLNKELEDLKLEVAHQKSRNLLSQHELSNQILDVLNTELTCVICSDIIIEVVTIECGHIFCSHCISTWFHRPLILRSCPMCRTFTYKDPIKISNLNSTIASLHAILPQEVQSDRLQHLEDRKAEQKKAQEASDARSQRGRIRHLDFLWDRERHTVVDTAAEIIGSMQRRRHHRPSPVIHASEVRSSGLGQPISVQPQAHVDPLATVSSSLQSGNNSDEIIGQSSVGPDSLNSPPSFSQLRSSAASNQNPTRPTRLPLSCITRRNQV